MKNIFIIISFLFFACNQHSPKLQVSGSQPSLKDSLTIQDLDKSSEIVLKKEYNRLYEGKWYYIDILRITNLETGKIDQGIRIGAGGILGPSSVGFIEKDEIDKLINSMQQMKTESLNPASKSKTQYFFTSRSGFQASLHNNEGKWIFSIKGNKANPGSFCPLDKKGEMDNFYSTIMKAKQFEFK
jgi:hypothetical protein